MSRSKIEVRHRYEFVGDVLIVLTEHWYHGELQKTARTDLNVKDNSFRVGMILAGWLPPVEYDAVTDQLTIDRRLSVIAGDSPQAPMLSYRGDGKFTVGGILDSEQLVALAALSTQVKK